MKFNLVNIFIIFGFLIFSFGIASKAQVSSPFNSALYTYSTPASATLPTNSPTPQTTNPLPMPSIFPGCTLSSSIVDLPPKTNYICGGFCGLNMDIPCLLQNGVCGDNCPRSLIDEFFPRESPSPFNPYDHI